MSTVCSSLAGLILDIEQEAASPCIAVQIATFTRAITSPTHIEHNSQLLLGRSKPDLLGSPSNDCQLTFIAFIARQKQA